MEGITLIWYQSPEIWAAVISGCFALCSTFIAIALFKRKNFLISKLNKELETHKSELERKNIEIQTALNTQLEKVRIQYGIIHTKRLDILYEACERINILNNRINQLASYHDYDCLPNIDFSSDCKKAEHACDKECIVHYSNKVIEFRQYTRELCDFFVKNEMFFSLETVIAHLKLSTIMLELSAKAIDIVRDLERDERSRAVDCFKLFNEFDGAALSCLHIDLVSQYRLLIGVPTSIELQ